MRLIDADVLEQKMASPFVTTYKDARQAVKDAPTVDAVPVVRCKDCEYYVETNGRIGTCELTISGAEDDGFCAWGVRKEK